MELRIVGMGKASRLMWQTVLASLICAPIDASAGTLASPMKNPAGATSLPSGEMLFWGRSKIQVRDAKGLWSKPVSYAPFLVYSIFPQGNGRAVIALAGNDAKTKDGLLKDELVGVALKNASVSKLWQTTIEGHFVAGASDGQQVWILNAYDLSTIDNAGKLSFVSKRQLGETSVLPGGVVCKRYLPRKDQSSTEATGARCRKANAWSFDGNWSKNEPMLCGSWLLEPLEQRFSEQGTDKRSPDHSVRLRNVQNGAELARVNGPFGQLACLPDAKVLDLGSQFVLSLPSLKKLGTARCGAGRVHIVTGTVGSAKKTGCLDTLGRAAFLSTTPLSAGVD
jgi:hypothetical protein